MHYIILAEAKLVCSFKADTLHIGQLPHATQPIGQFILHQPINSQRSFKANFLGRC